MKFWQLNCNTLNKSKLVEFKKLLSDENPTIVCLHEKWWSNPIRTIFKVYEMAEVDREKTGRQHSKGGEVAIFINEDYFQIAEILDMTIFFVISKSYLIYQVISNFRYDLT